MFGRRNNSDLNSFKEDNANRGLEELESSIANLEQEEVQTQALKTYNLGLLVWFISFGWSFYLLFKCNQ